MAVYLGSYNSLREEFLSVAQSNIDSVTLQTLKEYYAETIGSVRRLSYINDISNLIKILEKRDLVSSENIEPFLYICNKYLKAIQLQSKLIAYNGSLSELRSRNPLCNMYQRDFERMKKNEKLEDSQKIPDIPNCERIPQHGKENATSSNSSTDDALKTTIFLYISERLGRSWRDVARYLGLRECDITLIESRYSFDLKEQSYQALQRCFAESTALNWKLELLQSLEKARRRDLKELAERMIFSTESA